MYQGHCIGNGDGTVSVSKLSLFPLQEACAQAGNKERLGDGGEVMHMTYD